MTMEFKNIEDKKDANDGLKFINDQKALEKVKNMEALAKELLILEQKFIEEVRIKGLQYNCELLSQVYFKITKSKIKK